MPIRIPWDQYEVALLFRAYERVIAGSSINEEAINLSDTLRKIANRRGIVIDDTFRNINGMKMQLGNVQYLFSEGKKGLSGASSLIREMYKIYRDNRDKYLVILKDAIRLIDTETYATSTDYFHTEDKKCHIKSYKPETLEKEISIHMSQDDNDSKDLVGDLSVFGEINNGDGATYNHMTIKDAIIKVLRDAGEPLTISEIMRRLERQNLYESNANNPSLVLYQTIKRYCKDMDAHNSNRVNVFERLIDNNGQFRYTLIDKERRKDEIKVVNSASIDVRWLSILQDNFPDGYILKDFLSQLQAASHWEDRYGEACLLEGEAIDEAMKSVGVVCDDRVVLKSDENHKLITSICAEINTILLQYTTVYRKCIYDRYQNQLALCKIYTEQVMTEQLLAEAKGSFYSLNQSFVKSGQKASVIHDCREVLLNHGGAMSVNDIAKILWFIPYKLVYHYLSVDDEALSISNGIWMLADHFPLTKDEADLVGDTLDEYFLSHNYIQESELLPLIRHVKESIADNLSSLHFSAVFNILDYYLKDRFSFSRAIIAPKGKKIDFSDLFQAYAKSHEKFSLVDLTAFASELKVPIYWESLFSGGVVRVSKTEFVNRSQVLFDIENIDAILEKFCTNDYLSLQAISSPMMMHLPSCGYQWNGYLLLSYVYTYSKVFWFAYNSMVKNGYYGALVKRSCEKIDSYERLVEQVLTDDDSWMTDDEALELLVKNGFQAQRRLKGIEEIVSYARQNKLSSDGR